MYIYGDFSSVFIHFFVLGFRVHFRLVGVFYVSLLSFSYTARGVTQNADCSTFPSMEDLLFTYCETKTMNILQNSYYCGSWVCIQICANCVCVCVHIMLLLGETSILSILLLNTLLMGGEVCLPVAMETLLTANHRSLHPTAALVCRCAPLPAWIHPASRNAYMEHLIPHFLCNMFYLLQMSRWKPTVTSCGHVQIIRKWSFRRWVCRGCVRVNILIGSDVKIEVWNNELITEH